MRNTFDQRDGGILDEFLTLPSLPERVVSRVIRRVVAVGVLGAVGALSLIPATSHAWKRRTPAPVVPVTVAPAPADDAAVAADTGDGAAEPTTPIMGTGGQLPIRLPGANGTKWT